MSYLPDEGIKFRETPGDYDFDFHCAPARQFVVSLDAAVDIEVTDGTRRIFPAGTVMLAEDTWGKVRHEMQEESMRYTFEFIYLVAIEYSGSGDILAASGLAPWCGRLREHPQHAKKVDVCTRARLYTLAVD